MAVNLLILSTPRTGSNALCECLTAAQTLGTVEGYFVGWGDNIKQDFAGRDQSFREPRAHNGNFATKVMWDYLDHIALNTPQYGLVPDWLADFSHVLWLDRRDVVAQAVSWFMALGSGKWTSANEKKRDWPAYHYRHIAHHVGMIEGYNARTANFIETSGLLRLRLNYEDISEDWIAATQRVFDFCGLEPAVLQGPELQRQINPLKKEYILRYTQDWIRA